MGLEWIKVELDISEKPEVLQIATELNISPFQVVGMLIKVWSWFDRHTKNGNAFVTLLALLRCLAVRIWLSERFFAHFPLWISKLGMIIPPSYRDNHP